MGNILNRNSVQIAITILSFLLIVTILYPFCKYYIDPDSTAYLTIIKRYAKGDYYAAFNGYWSPLHPFISGLLMRYAGITAYESALYINVLASILVLVFTYQLFSKYRQNNLEKWLFCCFSAIYWAGAVYFQLVADQLGLAIVLIVIIFLTDHDFLVSKRKWLFAGLLSGLAIYAKAYNAYAIIFILFVFLFFCHIRKVISIRQSLRILSYVTIPMAILALPLAYTIHLKYDIWALSLAGKLNFDWFTVGTQVFKHDIKILVPPPYVNSVSHWEDPFLTQGPWHSIFSDFSYFLRYLLRLGYNFISWITTMNQLSFFYSTTWVVTAYFFFSQTKMFIERKLQELALVALLYPVGLWLIAIEVRYLWPTLIPVMILGLYLYDLSIKSLLSPLLRSLFLILFFVSFLPGMINDIRYMTNNGKHEFEMAQSLRKRNIRGGFLCNKASESGQLRAIQTLAYFSGNAYYYYPRSEWTTQELLDDAGRYGVPYFYYFYDGLDSDFQLLDEDGLVYPEVTDNSIPGLLVFKIN